MVFATVLILGAYKKRLRKRLFTMSTRGRTRTGTSLRTMDFKSIVSTNSTTRAISEASAGFEPANNSFANCPLKPLGYDAIYYIKLTGNLQNDLSLTIPFFIINLITVIFYYGCSKIKYLRAIKRF